MKILKMKEKNKNGYPQKINWAIVGLGSQAEVIAKAIKSAKNSELLAVVSKSKERAKEFAGHCGVKNYFDSLAGLFKKLPGVNSVFIASATNEHASQAVLSLKFKKNVLCEKPMAPSPKEARIIELAVKKSRVKFGVDFHLRNHPLIREAKTIITSGKLGKILLADMNWSIGRIGETRLPPLNQYKKWREDIRKSGGGAITARGVHLFDLLRFLTQKEVEEVKAFTDNGAGGGADTLAIGLLRLGDTFAKITTGRKLPNSLNDIVIYGSQARLILKGVLTPGAASSLEIFSDRQDRLEKQPALNLYQKEIEDFNSLILGKRGVTATVQDGIKNVLITDAFLKSAKTGQSIRIS